MHSFKDCQGQEWMVDFDIPLRTKVLADTGFDLFSVLAKEQMLKLAEFETLVSVLYAICEDQVRKLNITPEQFARRFKGDVFRDAHEALIGAVADFFPSHQREPLVSLMKKGKLIAERAVKAMMEQIEKVNPDEIVQQILKNAATNLPESSELTQTSAMPPSVD